MPDAPPTHEAGLRREPDAHLRRGQGQPSRRRAWPRSPCCARSSRTRAPTSSSRARRATSRPTRSRRCCAGRSWCRTTATARTRCWCGSICSREFGTAPRAFHHAVEAYKIRDELARAGVGAVVWADWAGLKMELVDAVPANAALLDAGRRARRPALRLALRHPAAEPGGGEGDGRGPQAPACPSSARRRCAGSPRIRPGSSASTRAPARSSRARTRISWSGRVIRSRCTPTPSACSSRGARSTTARTPGRRAPTSSSACEARREVARSRRSRWSARRSTPARVRRSPARRS